MTRSKRAAIAAIEAAGGLYSLRGMSRKLGVSATWMGKLSQRDTFPAPLDLEGVEQTKLWLLDEVTDWLADNGYHYQGDGE